MLQIPLFILVGRNNPLIPLLGISFDTYNLIHRWFGRIVILEAICHTLAHLAKDGWGKAWPDVFSVTFIRWGFIVGDPFTNALFNLQTLREANQPTTI